MKSEEAKRLKLLEDNIQMLKHVASGNLRGGWLGTRVNSSASGLDPFTTERWGAASPFAEACGDL
jgi:hypothetical protein